MTSILEEVLQDIIDDAQDLKHRVSRVERRESRQRHLNSGKSREVTVAAGAITVRASDSALFVDTQDDDATDELITINGGTEGQIIIFSSISGARDTTFQQDTDNLSLAGDFTLSTTQDTIMLRKANTGDWHEISRSDNA